MQRKCYSYIRFSSKKQALGTSLDRQADIESFLDRHNLVLDTRLEDLGVSAYRGKNASKGQLGDFLALVRAGQIDTNSVLLIENFDRLSRQKIIKSTQIFIELMSQGIDLGILDLGRIYTRESLVSSDFFNVILEFERANKESERKSDFTSAAWNFHRAEMQSLKIPKTRKTPSWIAVEGKIKGKKTGEGDARFVVIEKEAEKIRKIFELALVNGLTETARKINEQLDSGEKKYTGHNIQYILKNRKVIGEHQPMKYYEIDGEMKLLPEGPVIEEYYPPIIEKSIFNEVQEKTKARKPFSGRHSQKYTNIFSGLLSCYHCSGTVRYMNKSTESKPSVMYYICTNSMTGRCTVSHRLSYDAIEAMKNFFEKSEKLNLSDVLEADERIERKNQDISDATNNQANLAKQIHQLQGQIQDALVFARKIPQFLTDLLFDKEKEKEELEAQISRFKEEKKALLEQIEAANEFTTQNVFDLINDDSEFGIRKRIRINNHLLKLIRSIKLFWRKKPGGLKGMGVPTMVVEFANGNVRIVVEDGFIVDSDKGDTGLILKILAKTHAAYLGRQDTA